MDRRALIIGCWDPLRPPSPQKIRGVVDRVARAYTGPIISCGSFDGADDEPTKLYNPSYAEILQQIEQVLHQPTADTQLFLYYVGHSVPSAENDLSISLGQRSQILNSSANDTEIEMRPVRLSKILDELAERGFSNVIAVFDTCHSGRAVDVTAGVFQDYVVMTSTGTAYAYNAEFSDAYIATLERPLHAKDQRVDKSVRAITFKRIFQFAKSRLDSGRSGDPASTPCISGPLMDAVALEVPLEIPRGYNSLAQSRSIYHRVREIVKLLDGRRVSLSDLLLEISGIDAFILNRKTNRAVSSERIAEYVNFLVASRLVEEKKGQYSLTHIGEDAAGLFFNETLLSVIENQLFPNELTFDALEQAIQNLIDDRLVATPNALAERLRMNGQNLPLNDANRFALKLLPSTRRFGKGSSDALHIVSEV